MDKLSIILPTHNEVKSLEFVLHNWHEFLVKNKIIHEFVVCEDGSTDGTKELILSLMTKYPIVNETTIERRGYGGGVLAGISSANYNFILCIDSDGQCLPDSFINFWKNRHSFNVIIGNRNPRRDPIIRKLYSFLFLVLHRILFPSNVKDPSCPYILAHKSVYKKLKNNLTFMREGFWWGFVGAALKINLKFGQFDVNHYERYDGSSVVYKLSKMPLIILRNVIGLIKLRFA
jgi:glycosyltransferase involved in cell wall biosynthesis